MLNLNYKCLFSMRPFHSFSYFLTVLNIILKWVKTNSPWNGMRIYLRCNMLASASCWICLKTQMALSRAHTSAKVHPHPSALTHRCNILITRFFFLMFRQWGKIPWSVPKVNGALFWAETHPQSKFFENPLCSFCVVLLTNQQTNIRVKLSVGNCK